MLTILVSLRAEVELLLLLNLLKEFPDILNIGEFFLRIVKSLLKDQLQQFYQVHPVIELGLSQVLVFLHLLRSSVVVSFLLLLHLPDLFWVAVIDLELLAFKTREL